MTFLEVQLERVNAACANYTAQQERVDALQAQLSGQDEKITNISRLVKLLQSFSEAQEEDVNNIKLSIRSLGVRVEEAVTTAGQHYHPMQQPGFFV